ncbi:MAG TPA: nitrilase-related carbon-nitrogen hydrolase [Gaiellaceae bacterium]|nr:nitrilase-related carbon-nitrogen hydrolase [Gaiellaceae bacterium]
MRTARPWTLAATAAATSAALLWLASPAVGDGWVAWVALAPVAAAALTLEGTRAGRAAVPLAVGLYLETQLVPGLPFGIAEAQWGVPPLPIMVRDSPVVFAALVGVPLFAAVLYALRFPQPLRRPGPAAAVAVPAVLWTGLDVLRPKLDPSGLWGPLFLTQHDLPTAALAALAGPWLLTTLIVATGWALAALAVRRRAALVPAAAVAAAVAAAAGVVVAVDDAAPEPSVAIALVQPGYDTAEYGRYEPPRFFDPRIRNLELATADVVVDLAELTRDAAARGADVVLWPEAVAWVDPLRTRPVRTALRRLVAETEAALVVPAFVDPRSSVLALRADGEWVGPRPKQRPMWFLGERTVDAPRGPLALGGVRAGVLLGIDNEDPGAARALARSGAELLVSATHDWQELLPQQRAYARLHAVALRRPVAKVDWRYGSAVWDAGGRLVADAGGERARDVVLARVAPSTRATPYERIGDVAAWAAVAASALLLVVGIRGRRSW